MVRSMRAKTSLLNLAGWVCAVTLVWGCGASSGGMGCASLQPIPSGRYAGPKSDNALNMRLSPNGINYLNSNWQTLIDLFAPGQVLSLPVPCTPQDIPVIGKVAIADQGGPSGGTMDGICDSRDVPKNVEVRLTGFSLVPTSGSQVEAQVSVEIQTGDLYVATEDDSHGACVYLSAVKCSLNFNTAAESPSNNSLKATVSFTIDQKWDNLLSFKVTALEGSSVCGASGAQPKPFCLDPADLNFEGRNNCGNVYCTVADWDPVKNSVLKLISPQLEKKVKDAVAQQSCQSCGTGLPACPQLPNATSSCVANQCIDTANSQCVPRFLGLEGRMAVGSVLSDFGVSAESQIDLSVAAGSSVLVDQGITLGMRAGTQAVAVSACVPAQAAPPLAAVPAPNFDAEATPGSGYHVGLGLSQPFLNRALHESHQAGALCVGVTSTTIGLLNTGLFKTFLPSLGRLTTRDGKDAPMMIVLRPAQPPSIAVGLGTYDPVTKRPIKPLLTMTLPSVTMDFYAMLDDRYVRLFSLTADISLPLSLIFEQCSTVQPALGDLKMVISNITTSNSEILAEDPRVLADLIPAVIGFVEPALANALKPFNLPTVGNFKLKVNESKGVSLIPGTQSYYHLGLYATLMPQNAQCAVTAPLTVASLKQSVMPKAEDMRATGNGLKWPTAVLDVQALGVSGTPEFAYRIDNGLWSTFLRPDADGSLAVSHPAFLMQGVHVIEVRSRMAEEAHGISAPVKVGFVVDWEGPEVTLAADRENDRLNITAHDVVSADSALQYAYRVGNGSFSSFGPAREISLSSIENGGGLTVQVRDEAGLVTEVQHKVAVEFDRPSTGQGDAAPQTSGVGCSVVPSPLWALSLLGALTYLRRQKRW